MLDFQNILRSPSKEFLIGPAVSVASALEDYSDTKYLVINEVRNNLHPVTWRRLVFEIEMNAEYALKRL